MPICHRLFNRTFILTHISLATNPLKWHLVHATGPVPAPLRFLERPTGPLCSRAFPTMTTIAERLEWSGDNLGWSSAIIQWGLSLAPYSDRDRQVNIQRQGFALPFASVPVTTTIQQRPPTFSRPCVSAANHSTDWS